MSCMIFSVCLPLMVLYMVTRWRHIWSRLVTAFLEGQCLARCLKRLHSGTWIGSSLLRRPSQGDICWGPSLMGWGMVEMGVMVRSEKSCLPWSMDILGLGIPSGRVCSTIVSGCLAGSLYSSWQVGGCKDVRLPVDLQPWL